MPASYSRAAVDSDLDLDARWDLYPDADRDLYPDADRSLDHT